MDPEPATGILDYYAALFRPGMVDLSTSSPAHDPGGPARTSSDYPPPGGLPELRREIAGLYPGLGPENIIVTNGASEALAACAFAFVQRGACVYADQGGYPSFVDVARRLGGRMLEGAVEAAGPTDLALVNSPAVPSGRLHDIGAVVRAWEERGARVIADEVYLDLRAGSPMRPAVAESGMAVSIGDLSKPLGLGGLRIGWAASHDRGALEAIGRAVQLLSGGPSQPAMREAICGVREYGPRFAARMAMADRNAAKVFAALRDAGWSYVAPEAGWTFVAEPPVPLSEADLVRVRAHGYFLVPASAFGLASGYRLSLFSPVRALREALEVARPGAERASGGVVVLGKAPRPGLAKTRLAADIGGVAASALAEAFVDDTLRMASSAGWPLTVAFTPPGAREEFECRSPGARLAEQVEGDLGERISAALAGVLGSHSQAVLIGTDTPQLTREGLEDAFAALELADVVLGPAVDGGFYLLGARRGVSFAALFAGVEWSTGGVFGRVVANAEAGGLRVRALAPMVDIDDAGSLRAALANGAVGAVATREALARLGSEGSDGE